MPFSIDEKLKAVVSQRRMFTDYVARLSREGKLSSEQVAISLHITAVLDEVIEDYKAASKGELNDLRKWAENG